MTDRITAILAELHRRESAGLPAPTYRELGRICRASTSTVSYTLSRMAARGLVTLGGGHARSVRLAERRDDEALLREIYGLLEGIGHPIVERLRVRLGVES